MHIFYSQRIILAVLCLFFTILSPLGKADTTYSVSLNISSLTGNAAGPFQLDFSLLDGSGTGDANNTIQLRNFNYLESTFALTDTQPFNEILVGPPNYPSLPPNTLSFWIDTTNNLENPPDSFIFRILDSDSNPIPTTDPTLANSFLTIALDSATGTVLKYGTADNSTIAIGEPTVQLLSSSSVPEPSTGFLLMVGFGGLLAARRNLKFGRSKKKVLLPSAA